MPGQALARAGGLGLASCAPASLLAPMTDLWVAFGQEGTQGLQVQKTQSLRIQIWLLGNSHPITLAYSLLLLE